MPAANEPRPASNGERGFAFGSLRLLPSQRLLLEGDKPVRLGSRALDILTVLAENAGRVVPKDRVDRQSLAEHLCRREQS
jgi:DNA-binding winged helix-turn-helix (wHTH) protein